MTYHMWQHRNQFKILPVPCPSSLNLSKSDVRFDLDEFQDLEKLKRLCEGLPWQVPATAIVEAWLAGKHVKFSLACVVSENVSRDSVVHKWNLSKMSLDTTVYRKILTWTHNVESVGHNEK